MGSVQRPVWVCIKAGPSEGARGRSGHGDEFERRAYKRLGPWEVVPVIEGVICHQDKRKGDFLTAGGDLGKRNELRLLRIGVVVMEGVAGKRDEDGGSDRAGPAPSEAAQLRGRVSESPPLHLLALLLKERSIIVRSAHQPGILILGKRRSTAGRGVDGVGGVEGGGGGRGGGGVSPAHSLLPWR